MFRVHTETKTRGSINRKTEINILCRINSSYLN